jgi:hypothetical protein
MLAWENGFSQDSFDVTGLNRDRDFLRGQARRGRSKDFRARIRSVEATTDLLPKNDTSHHKCAKVLRIFSACTIHKIPLRKLRPETSQTIPEKGIPYGIEQTLYSRPLQLRNEHSDDFSSVYANNLLFEVS